MGIADDYQLSFYEDVSIISERSSEAGSEVSLVKDTRDNRLYVKKSIKISEENVYHTIMNYEKDFPERGNLKGIPKIFVIAKQEENLVVVEEHINHPTLGKVIDSQAIKPWELIVIFRELCKTMEPLHTLEPPIIHRDIKPDNIMVNMNAVRGASLEPAVYVIDWNAAREYSYTKERDTQLMGTIEFAAPEQLGYGQSDVRTDIFGIGATLEYCIREIEAKSVIATESNIWRGLKAIVKKAKSLSPNDRYSCDRQMIDALDELLITENLRAIENNTGISQEVRQEAQQRTRSDISYNQPTQSFTGHRSKLNFTPPGFRTKKLKNMVTAIIIYIMIFNLARDITVDGYTGIYLIYFILLLCHVLWFSNYLGVQEKLKITKIKSKIVRVICHVLVVSLMWLMWAIIVDIPIMFGLV